MNFKGSYLRVITPKTTNGIIPLIIDGKVQEKESFLPMSARKMIEAKNRRIARTGHSHLIAKIEEVKFDERKAKIDFAAELEKLKAENEALMKQIEGSKSVKKDKKVPEPQN